MQRCSLVCYYKNRKKNSLIMWGHIDLNRKIRLTSMVWYRKYQLRYIIALWSQQWKRCVSSGSLLLLLHLVNYFTRGRDSGRRCDKVTSLLSPTKFSSNVLKTLSSLGLHAEKKEQLQYFKTKNAMIFAWLLWSFAYILYILNESTTWVSINLADGLLINKGK